jgi:3-dehydroquinate dehydratase/shikimate dehydrogenase
MEEAMTRLAVSLISATVAPLEADARQVLAGGADLVELRLDHLESIEPQALAALLARLEPGRVIVTCRPTGQGGRFAAGDAQRIALLAALARGRGVLLDLEWETWQRSNPVRQQIGQALGGDLSRLILSAHDFASRPADPAGLMRQIHQANPAGIAKLAWQAADARDNLEAFTLMRSGHGRSIVVCMGQAGLASRVLARKFAAYLTYCSRQPGAEAAPGQIDIHQIRSLFGWDGIHADTAVFGVVGWPIGHSLSPAIHNAAFRHAGINAVYLPLAVQPTYDAFADFVRRALDCEGLRLGGLSVTIPHKVHALRVADAVEPLARRIGAANTLIVDPKQANRPIRAINTDYAGAVEALTAGLPCRREELSEKRCTVLGAGGAARAVVAGLVDCGCRVTIYNRTAEKARTLAEEFGCAWQPFERRADLDADVVVNTTSVGMYPRVDDSPLPPDVLRPGMVVFETIYNPLQTLLLQQATRAGCRTISGLEMFVSQAALQFEAWTHQPAPRDRMRRAVVQQLEGS